MEVRCGKCNKLFRVHDDKITGKGIKFRCTRCHEYVKITREEFEQYKTAQTAAVEASTPDLTTPDIRHIDHEFMPAATHPAGPAASEIPATVAEAHGEKKGPTIELTGYDVGDMTSFEPQLSEPAPSKPEPVVVTKPPSPPEREIPKPVPPLRPLSVPVQAEEAGGIHPFVSGPTAGIAAGIGCAIAVIALMFLGIGVVSMFIKGPAPEIPLWYSLGMAAASIVGLGIIIGTILAMFQAGSDRKMFSVLGVVIATFITGLIGAAQGIAVAMGSGAVLSAVVIASTALGWAVKGLLLSIVIVIIRRNMMTSKKESFSARISGAQMIMVFLSLAMVGAGVYSEVVTATTMKEAKDRTVGAVQEIVSPEGLQVGNLSGYIDMNGDLVITGVVENTTDKAKPVWYLVAEVYDARGNVLTKAKMLSGRQIYSMKDYEIMSRRGVNVQEFKMKNMQEKGVPLPPHSVMNFEIRVMEPPVGITTFLVIPQAFDPVQVLKEAAEEMKQHQGQ